MKKIIIGSICIICIMVYVFYTQHMQSVVTTQVHVLSPTRVPTPLATQSSFPLAIPTLRQRTYQGSTLSILQTLPPTATYTSYIVSYLSDGLIINALLTVPLGKKPPQGWPVILFNHGYIPPAQYSTENSYASMVVPLASQGYIVFKPDYRGNGNSQGIPEQVYVSPSYVIDSLNALAVIRLYKDANPEKIGVIGHSMGGNITLHELVISSHIKAAELLSSVVGSYSAILDWWHNRIAAGILIGNDAQTAQVVTQFTTEHGTPQTNPDFWNAIDPTHFLSDISAPIQIQVGTGDTVVPYQFSQTLAQSLSQQKKIVSYIEYPGADHNLSPDLASVMQRTIAFFDQYLKQ